MAKTTRALSPTEVSKAKPGEKERSLADGGGLLLRIRPSGVKSWVFNYSRPITKKRANLSFGTYPALSLAQARQMRQEAASLLAQGIDPQEHRKEQELKELAKITNTFQAHALKWYELKRSKIKPETLEKMKIRLEKHAMPKLGKLPLAEIKPDVVLQALKPLADAGKIDTFKRICRYMNEIMRLAVVSGDIEFNRLSEISVLLPSYDPTNQHQLTLKPEELPELVQALHNAKIRNLTRSLIEWQLHTMTRPTEAASTRWADIDFEKGLWAIPGKQMKMKRDHVIPLTPQALAILERCKPESGHRTYVFPGQRDPKTHLTSQTANMALKRMGFQRRLVAHGLRALASTTLNEKGFDSDLIETALAHVDKNETRRAYNRAEYIERRREMMQWWSEHIESAARSCSSQDRSSL